ncbi:zinc ribbon domain-containing protein [Streptomyces spiralis]|uniref:zinc ribbon domain-containing protein n=1 Tax=Streptomyces spiralis TaxID=66376 RepID=UPI0036B5BEC5
MRAGRSSCTGAWTFVKVGRFEPSSQVCSVCGHLSGPKPVAGREWTSAACGTLHDRDRHAAKNLKAAPAWRSAGALGGGRPLS